MKVINGTSRSKPTSAAHFVRTMQAAGVTVHGWGFHYCRNTDEAQREAAAAAEACAELGLVDYHWNAEKQWAHESEETPQATAVAFARMFRDMTNGHVQLWANCFTSGMDAATIAEFDVWEPMMYGTRPQTIVRHVRKRLNRFGDAVPRSMMVGTGRVDDEGNIWGFFADRGDVPGLASIVRAEKPFAVTFYRAPLNWQGNPYNPSVPQQLAIMQGRSWPTS